MSILKLAWKACRSPCREAAPSLSLLIHTINSRVHGNVYVLVQHWVAQQHDICCPLRATHTEIFIFKYRFTAIVAVAMLFVQTAEQKMWLNLKIIRLMLKIELIVWLFLKSLISWTQKQRDLTWIEHRCSHTVLLTVCLCHIVLHTNCATCCGAEAWGK